MVVLSLQDIGIFLRIYQPQVGQVSKEGCMNTIHRSIVALVLAFVGLAGCDYGTRTDGNANPARVAEMQENLRDLWVGHIFWVRHVVSNIATNDPEERDAAEKEVVANTKQVQRRLEWINERA